MSEATVWITTRSRIEAVPRSRSVRLDRGHTRAKDRSRRPPPGHSM
jgi:hypothetical protein